MQGPIDSHDNHLKTASVSARADECAYAGGSAVSGGAGEPVTLMKGRHRWTFSCDAGGESLLLRRLSELARSAEAPFDWFDAALVSHQLSRRLRSDLNRVAKTTENR